MVLTPKIDRPIDTLTLAILREVRDVATELGLEMFLMGATARIILLEHVYGLRTGRATRDVDFAFAVENWSQFQAVKQCLIATSRFEAIERVEQRLLYKSAGIKHTFAVDIIPFGGLAGENNMIAWPPDMSFLMSVAGYADVQASAVNVEVEPRLAISIASIPGLAILKLFAWLDRGQEDAKDAIDLVTLLQQYSEAGNQERVYEEAVAELEAAGYDVELAGAWLLGVDAAALSSPATRSQLDALFAEPSLVERLVTDMSRAMRAREDALDYSRTLLKAFLKGLNVPTTASAIQQVV